jgi:hypothetical protein
LAYASNHNGTKFRLSILFLHQITSISVLSDTLYFYLYKCYIDMRTSDQILIFIGSPQQIKTSIPSSTTLTLLLQILQK